MFAQELRSIGVKNTTTFNVRPVRKGKSVKEKLMKEEYLRRGFIGTRKEEEECAKWIQEKIKDIRFKSEEHKTLEKLLRKDYYAVSIDLSQAYFLVPVHKDFTPFLAFGFGERTSAFKGLPFSHKDAPRILTKLMRKVVQQVRKRWRVRCMNYFYDIIILHEDKDALQKATTEIEDWFNNLGLVVNEEKSRLTPRKTFSFLGWTWNTRVMKVALETKRRLSLQKKIKRWMNFVSKKTSINPKKLTLYVGIISLTRFVYADASLHMNRLYKELNNAVRETGWTGAMNLNLSIRKQIQYW